MAELDLFERSLAAALRAFADRGRDARRRWPASSRRASPRRPRWLRGAWSRSRAWPGSCSCELPCSPRWSAGRSSSARSCSGSSRPWCRLSTRCSSARPGRRPTSRGRSTRPGRSGWRGMRLAFDRRAGKLVALAGDDSSVETWTFDVCTNTWTRMHPNQEPPPGTGQLVYDVDSDLTIASDGTGCGPTTSRPTPGRRRAIAPFVIDCDASGSTTRSRASSSPGGRRRRRHPGPGAVELRGRDRHVDPDPPGEAAGHRTPLRGLRLRRLRRPAGRVRQTCPLRGRRRPAAANRARTWLFDLRTGTWSGTAAVTPPDFNAGVWGAEPGIAYDEAAERTVMLGQGHSAAYDATADRWETLYVGTPLDSQRVWPPPGMPPDARHGLRPGERAARRLRGLPPDGGTGVAPDDILAFDTRTREWTVLLEASRAQPAP